MLLAIDIINALRKSDPYIETIYTQGGCYQLHLFLKALYPEALPVLDKTFAHVGTVIDGQCYDIRGVVGWSWYVMDNEEVAIAEKWSFARSQMLQLGECPVCEEPLLLEVA